MVNIMKAFKKAVRSIAIDMALDLAFQIWDDMLYDEVAEILRCNT